MKSINQLKAGTVLTYITMLISTIIPLLYTPVMLRILGQAEYGLYSLSSSIMSYLFMLTLGLCAAISRYIVKYIVANDKVMLERVIGLFVDVFFAIGVVVCIVGAIIAFFADSLFSKGLTINEINKLRVLIVLMSVNTAISWISSVYSNVITCHERFIFRKLVDMFLTIASPILNLVILFMGYASIGMAVLAIIVQIIGLLVNAGYCRMRLKIRPRYLNPPKELLKDIFAFSAFVFIGMIADLLYWSTDKILIGAMMGSIAVAVYNIGSTFNSLLQNLASAISGVFSPRVNSYVFKNKDISEISSLMIRVGRLQYLIVSLVLAGFVVFGYDFITLWAGNDYKDAYYVALMTLIPLAIPLIQNIAYTAICAMNKHKFRAIVYAILAVINVIGTYFLIPILGIVGASLCTCVVFVIGQGFIMNWYYNKLGFSIKEFWINILKMSIVPLIISVMYVIISHCFLGTVNVLAALLLRIIIFTLVYSLLTYLFTMNDYEKDLFWGIFRKIKGLFSKKEKINE